MEDKQKICDLLVPVLQETRDFQELESLKYNKDNENDPDQEDQPT